MILRDSNLLLRAIEKEDAPLLLEIINDPQIEASVVGFSYPVSKNQQEEWINNIQSDRAIRYAIDVDGGIVGVAIISSIDNKNRTANLNIKLSKQNQGKGYAFRTIGLIIEYCFNELNMNCLTANVIFDNEQSKKLWEKHGFLVDGVLRSRVYKNGSYKDLIAYSLLKVDYEKRNR